MSQSPSEPPPHWLPADVSPSDTLYIADRDLNVVYVNNHWVDFARANRGETLLGDQVRPNCWRA